MTNNSHHDSTGRKQAGPRRKQPARAKQSITYSVSFKAPNGRIVTWDVLCKSNFIGDIDTAIQEAGIDGSKVQLIQVR